MPASLTFHPQDAHFLDIFTHDIRSPLLGVYGCLREVERVIADIPDNDTPKADLADIKDGLARMETMLDGLLSICRRSRSALRIEDIDMDSLLAEIIEQVQAELGPFDIEVAPLPPCRADRDSLRVALVHLLHNAVRAGGPITVTGHQDERICYSITDQGDGLSEAMRRHCFELFTTDGSGDGIGLSLARHHVIRQQGWLRLMNPSSGGCRAEVSLPLQPSDAQP